MFMRPRLCLAVPKDQCSFECPYCLVLILVLYDVTCMCVKQCLFLCFHSPSVDSNNSVQSDMSSRLHWYTWEELAAVNRQTFALQMGRPLLTPVLQPTGHRLFPCILDRCQLGFGIQCMKLNDNMAGTLHRVHFACT